MHLKRQCLTDIFFNPHDIGCPKKKCPKDWDHSEIRGFLHQDAEDKSNTETTCQADFSLFTYQNKTNKQKH